MRKSSSSSSKTTTKKKIGELYGTILLKFAHFFELVLVAISLKRIRLDSKNRTLLPKHIAFVMDGNRRHAKKKKKTIEEGHRSGAEKLSEVLRWSLHLPSVKCVSVFAFSLENFKRSETEVKRIFEILKTELPKLAKSEQVLEQKCEIVVSGDKELLPKDVREACEFAERWTKRTKEERGCVLNVCVAYTGQLDFSNAIEMAIQESAASRNNDSNRNDDCSSSSSSITERTIRKHLYGNVRVSDLGEKNREMEDIVGDVDLLVRTSGATRLSDFMTTRLEKATIVFCDVLWPDFSFMDFFKIIWEYQKQQLRSI